MARKERAAGIVFAVLSVEQHSARYVGDLHLSGFKLRREIGDHWCRLGSLDVN